MVYLQFKWHELLSALNEEFNMQGLCEPLHFLVSTKGKCSFALLHNLITYALYFHAVSSSLTRFDMKYVVISDGAVAQTAT